MIGVHDKMSGGVIEYHSGKFAGIEMGDGLTYRRRCVPTVACNHDHEVGQFGQDSGIR